MAARQWKELPFSHGAFARFRAAYQSSARAFPKGVIWHFEDVNCLVVTNASHFDIAALCRSDDLRVPDYLRLPDDDDVVLELLAGRANPEGR
jgi:hypothetical protein